MYVPLDVNFPDDPKIMDAPLEVVGVYCMALCVAKRLPTDGVLTESHLRRLGADDGIIAALLASDLVRADVSGRPGHVQITSWLTHNESQAEIESKRQTDAQRKRAARRKRPENVRSDASTPSENVQPLDTEVETDIEVEVDAESVIISGDHPVGDSAVLDAIADLRLTAKQRTGAVVNPQAWRKRVRANLGTDAALLARVGELLTRYDDDPRRIAEVIEGTRPSTGLTKRRHPDGDADGVVADLKAVGE
jgi:hypothetical protein